MPLALHPEAIIVIEPIWLLFSNICQFVRLVVKRFRASSCFWQNLLCAIIFFSSSRYEWCCLAFICFSMDKVASLEVLAWLKQKDVFWAATYSHRCTRMCVFASRRKMFLLQAMPSSPSNTTDRFQVCFTGCTNKLIGWLSEMQRRFAIISSMSKSITSIFYV